MKKEIVNYLHYGAIISLQLTELNSENTFLYSDGFMSKKVIKIDFEKKNYNFDGCLFIVVPTY